MNLNIDYPLNIINLTAENSELTLDKQALQCTELQKQNLHAGIKHSILTVKDTENLNICLNTENEAININQENNTDMIITNADFTQSNVVETDIAFEESPISMREQQNLIQTETSNLVQNLEVEIKLYLNRIIGFSIALIIFSAIVLLTTFFVWFYHGIFACLYGYLFYSVYENMKKRCLNQRESWRLQQDALEVMESLRTIISLFIIHLKIQGIIQYSLFYAFPPCILTIIIYIFKSKAGYATSIKRIGIKLLFAAQIFLLTAKYDGLLNWSWNITFIPCWLFLGVISNYMIQLVLAPLILFLLTLLNLNNSQNNLFQEINGVFWRCLYYTSSVIAVLHIQEISKEYNFSADLLSLRIRALFGFCLAIIMFLYTFLRFDSLNVFLVDEKLRDVFGDVIEEEEEPSQNKKDDIKLYKIKQETLFVSLSSTYFKPLGKLGNFYLKKNKEAFQRIKTALGLLSKAKILKSNQGLNIKPTLKPSSHKKFKSILPNIHRADSHKDLELGMSNIWRKEHFSCDDIKNISLNEKSEKEKNVLCYLCYDNIPNFILMSCGHGRVCYDCVIRYIEHKGTCM